MAYFVTAVENNTNQEVSLVGVAVDNSDDQSQRSLVYTITIPANGMACERSDKLSKNSVFEEKPMYFSLSVDGKRCEQIVTADAFKGSRELVFNMVKNNEKISYAYTRYRGSWYSFPRLRMFGIFRDVLGGKVVRKTVKLTFIPNNKLV